MTTPSRAGAYTGAIRDQHGGALAAGVARPGHLDRREAARRIRG